LTLGSGVIFPPPWTKSCSSRVGSDKNNNGVDDLTPDLIAIDRSWSLSLLRSGHEWTQDWLHGIAQGSELRTSDDPTAQGRNIRSRAYDLGENFKNLI